MAATATIRVPRQTRDLLAEQAHERGVSLSAMLTDLARDLAREAILRSEREASRRDSRAAATSAEERDWETALGDGLD